MYYIPRRSVTASIIFTILTCGLYSIYWLACMANELNRMEENHGATSGSMVVLLTFLTCGLYLIYYVYMSSKRIYYMFEDCQVRTSDNAIINAILCLCSYAVPGAYLIAFAILQSDMNKLLDIKGNAKGY